MFSMALRGRRGRSLILVGVILLVIGLAITIGTYVWASGRPGGGHFYITFSPIILGIIAIVRGTSQVLQDRRAGVAGPGQEIPAGYGGPERGGPERGGQGPGAHARGARAYDQPGYAMPGTAAAQDYGRQAYAGQAYGGQAYGGQAHADGARSGAGQRGGQPQPDWYPDPQDPSQVRWWDGRAWTPHTQPRG